jgi:hypothetical protein
MMRATTRARMLSFKFGHTSSRRAKAHPLNQLRRPGLSGGDSYHR